MTPVQYKSQIHFFIYCLLLLFNVSKQLNEKDEIMSLKNFYTIVKAL